MNVRSREKAQEKVQGMRLALEGKVLKLERFRLLLFLLGLGVFLFGQQWPVTLWMWLLWALAFSSLVGLHSKFKKKVSFLKLLEEELEMDIARYNLDWDSLPERSTSEIEVIWKRSLASDLHFFGKRSLERLMNVTVSDTGAEALRNHMLDLEPDREDILRRQEKTRLLSREGKFRRRFQIQSRLNSRSEIALGKLRKFFESEVNSRELQFTFGKLLAWSLLGWLGALGYFSGRLGTWAFLPLMIYLGFWFSRRALVRDTLNDLIVLEISFQALANLRVLIRAYRHRLQKEFPSLVDLERVGSISRKALLLESLASVRAYPPLHFLLNLLFPYDFALALALRTLQVRGREEVIKWADALIELEIFLSLAKLSDLEDGEFPRLLENQDERLLRGRGFHHPLIPRDRRVSHDFESQLDSPISVVTGSNMSGKSTFLRNLATNLVLGLWGAKTCSKDFEMKAVVLRTLIKAEDHLEDEMSLFYFEVFRLKEMLERGEEVSNRFLCLVDEIFRGTNNEERFKGATRFLTLLREKGISALVTTHDLRIAEDAFEKGLGKNYHFEDLYREGKLVFDYQIKDGVASSTNAIRIMEREGILG